MGQAQTGQEVLKAIKTKQIPVLDGKLTDLVWLMAEPVRSFTISQPEFGNPSKVSSEVRLIYTDDAIYVGAMLYDDPKKIRRQLTPRDGDERQDTDKFGVLLDTYKDQQNAFYFLVTAANVQSDVRISSKGSSNGGSDPNWDAVWDSEVFISDSGWSVEMKIPYMSLRFASSEQQDWGLNFYRFTRRFNENAYWNTVDPKIDGLVNQSGTLAGLENLTPPLRLSFLPYVSTGFRTIPGIAGNNTNWLRNGGIDVKYGVNESFTLDMTLIPDFGQVQSDNVVLNLSPFEVRFDEFRPFFTEGTELFNKAGIFYSRRVGGIPGGYFKARSWAENNQYTLLKNPTSTQLYNGIKFSGRTNKNLGIGVFNAVTAPMYAEAKNERGEIQKFETEPLANFNILVLDQALKNRSYITFTNTNVTRQGNSRNGNVSALDLSFLDKKNRYNLKIEPRYSTISGSQNYNGWKNTLSIGKVSGALKWGINNSIESDTYDHNDLGILFAPNEFNTEAFVSWEQFTPNENFNYRRYWVSMAYEMLYKPFVYTSYVYNARFLHVFNNFWDISLNFAGKPLWTDDYFDLRTPGRMVKKTPYFYLELTGSTDSRKALFVSYSAGYANFSPIENDGYWKGQMSMRYRFNPKFSLSISPTVENDLANIGFSHFVGAEPVIGRRHVKNVTNILNGIYNFKARMTLTVRMRHYWSNVKYASFYNVKQDGWWTERPFENNRDQNFNAFNIDAFYTWDFMPGSRLIVSWKNAIGPEVNLNGIQYDKYMNNLGNMFTEPHSNEVSMRFIYFIDYNRLRKKKPEEQG
jgi:hypothetical protein